MKDWECCEEQDWEGVFAEAIQKYNKKMDKKFPWKTKKIKQRGKTR